MKLAINAQQLSYTQSLPTVLDVIEKTGVRAVELWPHSVPGGGDAEANERWETRDVADAARQLNTRGFEVACVTLGFMAAPICIARGGTQALAQALQGAVDAARVFGSALVNCYTAGVPLSLFEQAVRPAAAYAAVRGVVITLENEAHDESAMPADIAELVRRVGSQGFGTQYDPCNYYHANVEAYPGAYNVLRRHIRYVHLKGGCHYTSESSGVHKGSTMRESNRDFIGYLPLPEAAFPAAAIVRRLKLDGYSGFITLEPHVSAEHLPDFLAMEVPFVRAELEK